MTTSRACLLMAWVLALTPAIGSPPGAAENARAPLPKVGTIKDYPATGLMTGCGNSYFHFAADARKPDAAYVFLCGPDGDNAWMNLDGRDTRLKLVSSKLSEEANGVLPHSRSEYRAGRRRITVETILRDTDADFTLDAKITISAGKAEHITQALGYSDC